MRRDAYFQMAVHARLGPPFGESQDFAYSGCSGGTAGRPNGIGAPGLAVPCKGPVWYSLPGLRFEQGYGTFDPGRMGGGDNDACFRTGIFGGICPDSDRRPGARKIFPGDSLQDRDS